MANTVHLRRATLEDTQSLIELGSSTFRETFEPYNTTEDMDKYINVAFTVESIQKQLNHPNSIFYLAEFDGKLAGYMKLNFGDAQSEPIDQGSMEVERIYVRKTMQGLRIGQTLMQQAEAVANEKNFSLHLARRVGEES